MQILAQIWFKEGKSWHKIGLKNTNPSIKLGLKSTNPGLKLSLKSTNHGINSTVFWIPVGKIITAEFYMSLRTIAGCFYYCSIFVYI